MGAKISVIIPTYNRASVIGETLDSVIAQTFDDWECIVVDDGSDDSSDILLKEYMKRTHVFTISNDQWGKSRVLALAEI